MALKNQSIKSKTKGKNCKINFKSCSIEKINVKNQRITKTLKITKMILNNWNVMSKKWSKFWEFSKQNKAHLIALIKFAVPKKAKMLNKSWKWRKRLNHSNNKNIVWEINSKRMNKRWKPMKKPAQNWKISLSQIYNRKITIFCSCKRILINLEMIRKFWKSNSMIKLQKFKVWEPIVSTNNI